MKKVHHFTLIEMLVVIAIIGILASMMMPALQNALETSRSLSCINNLKGFGVAIAQYIEDTGRFMKHEGWDDGQTTYSWHLRIAGIKGSSQAVSTTYVKHLGWKKYSGNPYFCPAVDWSATNPSWSSYAVSSHMLGFRPSAFKKPSQTAALVDTYNASGHAAYVTTGSHWSSGWISAYPIHMNSSQNVLFLDSHVQTVDTTPRQYTPSFTPHEDCGGLKSLWFCGHLH